MEMDPGIRERLPSESVYEKRMRVVGRGGSEIRRRMDGEMQCVKRTEGAIAAAGMESAAVHVVKKTFVDRELDHSVGRAGSR